ncbi:MAG: hypothetical protein F4W93_14030 [Dehalococcoidia bacterium]|nr:hypothetical protein [Dehalococcoidia bacterium]
MTGRQGRTREQLRKSIGRNLIEHRLIVSTATSDGDETSLIDDTLLGGDDNYNGWWIVVKAGEIRRVSDYDATDAQLNWTRPLPEATAAVDSYELWPSEYPPEVIHDYINQAIGEAAGHIYEPVEDESLQAGGGVTRFPIPEGIDAIWKVQVRVSTSSPSPIDADSAVWRTLPSHLWGIDKGDRVLTLTDGGRRLAGSAPLKLVGGRVPSGLSSDASTTVVPDDFIIARATALALFASPDLSESGRAACEKWDVRTREARAAFPLLTNMRRVR